MAGAALALFVLIALPLAFLVGGGLTGDGCLRLAHFRDAVSSRLYVQALRNSLILGAATAMLSVAVGLPLARAGRGAGDRDHAHHHRRDRARHATGSWHGGREGRTGGGRAVMAASSRTGSWGDGMLPLDCVVFMLVRNGQVLAEKLKATRRLAPGAIALPGGHVDAGEGLEDALHRELHEELGVVAERTAYVCTLLHRA